VAAGGDMQIPAEAGEQALSLVLVAAQDFDVKILVMPCGAAEEQVDCLPPPLPTTGIVRWPAFERAQVWITVPTGQAACRSWRPGVAGQVAEKQAVLKGALTSSSPRASMPNTAAQASDRRCGPDREAECD
jgi:hypothetical protein